MKIAKPALKIESLENRCCLTVDFSLIADTDPEVKYSVREPGEIVEIGNVVSFLAKTPTTAPSVWLSPEGADQVILESLGLPYELHVIDQFTFGERALLTAYSAKHDLNGLWITDGTIEGTRWLADVAPLSIVQAGGNAYFFAAETDYDANGLWVTDGSPAGTRKLVIDRGPQDFRFTSPIGTLDGQIYFVVANHLGERSVATLDLATSEIVPLASFPRGNSAQIEALPGKLIIGNGWQNPGRQTELYAFDVATNRLTQLPQAPGSVLADRPALEVYGDQAFFPVGAYELWVTDGTVAGTRRFLDNSYRFENRANIARIGNHYVFAANHDPGFDYYFTDGTLEGTFNLNLGVYQYPHHLKIATNDHAFYVVAGDEHDDAHLYQISAADGAVVEIAGVHDLRSQPFPDQHTSFATYPVAFDERIFFTDSINSVAVLREFNEHSGVVRTVSIAESGAGSSIEFLANDDHHAWWLAGDRIWQSDGTRSATLSVPYDQQVAYGPSIRLAQTLDNRLVFEAEEAIFPSQQFRWEVDPSSGLARRLGVLDGSGGISTIFELGGKAYQLRNVDGRTAAVFELDGNLLPSLRVADTPSQFSENVAIHLIDERALFVIQGQLWQTDGSAAGTFRIQLGSPTERVESDLQRDESGAYFAVTNENRVYRVLPNATAPVLLGSTPLGISYEQFEPIRDGFVYSRSGASVQSGLWFFDSTGQTRLLTEMGGKTFDARAMVVGRTKDRVVAIIGGEHDGYGLWATDGTQEGTLQIFYDPNGGEFWQGAPNVTAQLPDGRLLLQWHSSELGREILITDGTALGTHVASDIATGFRSSVPRFVAVGSRVITSASTDEFGVQEVFSADLGGQLIERPNDTLRYFVEENSVGREIGRIILDDIPPSSVLAYAVVGSLSGLEFAIEFESGRLSLAPTNSYDYESLKFDQIVVDVSIQGPTDTVPQIRRVIIEVVVTDRLEPLEVHDQVFEIDENLPFNRYVGKISVSRDKALDVVFTYTGGYPFHVDRDTGQVFAPVDTSLLDYEVRRKLGFTVSVFDGIELSHASITVQLRDVNEPPRSTAAVGNIDIFSNQTMVHTFSESTFQDPEGAPMSLQVVALEAETLPDWIEFDAASRTLTTSPSRADVGATTLELLAMDPGGLTARAPIKIRIFSDETPWHNQTAAFDVNDDGIISPIDVLLVVNALNSGDGILPGGNPAFDPFVDTSADDFLSPIDALLVINYLNAQAASGQNLLE